VFLGMAFIPTFSELISLGDYPGQFLCGRGALFVCVWYYPVVSRAHPRCLGASCCVICSFCLGCLRLVSYCD
jgi:hypothetical protein